MATWLSSSATSKACWARSASSCALQLSVAFEDLGARVDSPGVRNDRLAALGLQERSSDLTRPNDKVPQAIKLLNDYVHLSPPRRTRIPANTSLSRSLLGTVILTPDFRAQIAFCVEQRLLSLVARP